METKIDIKFEYIPQMMVELMGRVNEIYSMMLALSAKELEKQRVALTIDVAASMICKSKSTLYKLVAAEDIPFHKQGKRLYFFEDELMSWIANHKNKTEQQAEFRVAHQAALEYISRRRNKPYIMSHMERSGKKS